MVAVVVEAVDPELREEVGREVAEEDREPADLADHLLREVRLDGVDLELVRGPTHSRCPRVGRPACGGGSAGAGPASRARADPTPRRRARTVRRSSRATTCCRSQSDTYETAADAYKKKSTYLDGVPGAGAAREAAARSSRAHGLHAARAGPSLARAGGRVASARDGRLPPDPRHGRARRRVRPALVHRVAAARAATAELREAESVRVRHRSRAGAGRALSGQVLPGRDELHRARRRDRLPVPVRGRVPRSRRVRPVRDGCVRPRAAGAVRVSAVGRRARVGTGERRVCSACPVRCCAPGNAVYDPKAAAAGESVEAA